MSGFSPMIESRAKQLVLATALLILSAGNSHASAQPAEAPPPVDPLGPSIVVRGDTFRIRGYGESRDAQDNIMARAWCEAVVQRIPEYVDNTEKADVVKPKQPLNITFGRRYRLLSFRWLVGPQE